MTARIDVKQLQYARVRQGFSQRGLARAAGVSALAVNYLEQGRCVPRPNTLKKICTALNIDITQIYHIV